MALRKEAGRFQGKSGIFDRHDGEILRPADVGRSESVPEHDVLTLDVSVLRHIGWQPVTARMLIRKFARGVAEGLQIDLAGTIVARQTCRRRRSGGNARKPGRWSSNGARPKNAMNLVALSRHLRASKHDEMVARREISGF
jgi:hypothetical protein